MEFSLSEFEPVGDRVHVAVAEPEGVNVGLVVGSTGALLVDTGSSPEQGRAIRQAYMEDMAHSEISQMTGLPLGTIKSRIRLGLERLRHELKDLKA